MSIQSDYALLAAGSYWDIRKFDSTFDNRAPLPAGWTVLTTYDVSGSGANSSLLGSGFSARVYKGPGGEIVIGYAGTEAGNTVTGLVDDFVKANVPMAAGAANTQALAAAQLYERVRADIAAGKVVGANGNISFTGHSLGGGLASVMAVWFNRPAYVFAPAPFQDSADSAQTSGLPDSLSTLVLPYVRYLLGSSADPALLGYNPTTDFAAREANVQSWTVKGEVLETYLTFLDTIVGPGNSNSLYQQAIWDSDRSAIDLAISKHSIDLHAAALLTPNFEKTANKVGALLPMLFDANLYGHSITGIQQNLLVKLIRNEVGIRADNGIVLQAANSALTHFSTDIERLTKSGTVNIAALNKGLIAVAMEYYYFLQSGNANEFFHDVAGGIKFDLNDMGNGHDNRGRDRLIAAVRETVDPEGYIRLQRPTTWYFQAGDGALVASSSDAHNTAMIGGTGDDTLESGAGNDYLNGGGGADTLKGGGGIDILVGGEGGDHLYGGDGKDIYIVSGNDHIIDSDGNGVIKNTSGQVISGFFIQTSDNNYVWSTDTAVTAQKTNSFIVTLADGSSIELENFQNGQFGIVLGDRLANQETTREVLGDVVPDYYYINGIGPVLTPDENASYRWKGHVGSWGDYLDAGSPQNDHIATGDLNDAAWGDGGSDRMEMGTGDDVGAGGEGDDVIQGNAGRDILSGGAGNDRIFSDDEVDIVSAIESSNSGTASGQKGGWITGGDGDDKVVGNGDDELLSGGAGSDLIIAGHGDDNILGDSDYAPQINYQFVQRGYFYPWGIERVPTPYYFAEVTSESFDWSYLDTQTERVFTVGAGVHDPAGAAGDVIFAGGGKDWVRAGRGDDFVYGEDGDDDIAGEQDDDTVFGGAGNDVISGDANFLAGDTHGDDFISGGDGDDRIFGQGGSDTIYGGNGADTILGDYAINVLSENYHGDDYIDGGADDDTIDGGSGNDTIFGAEGNDIAVGGKGDDYLNGGVGADQLSGGEDNDQLLGGSGDDIIRGGVGDDTLEGDEGADQLSGNEGNDTIFGGAGDDILVGHEGEDYLDGDIGDDQLGGGEGDDILYGDDGTDILDGGAGNDFLVGGDGNDEMDGGDGNDTLFGDDGDDVLLGNAGDDSLIGGAGKDLLGGGDGNDSIDGGADVDSVIGGAGNDLLNGGSGDDEIAGEDGDDTLNGGEGADLMDGGAGADVLLGEAGNDEMGGRDGNDLLYGGGGDDLITGDGGDDAIHGGDGADRLSGGSGNDLVDGGAGDDTLYGGIGNNILNGGAGSDILISTGDTDMMNGGSGNDIYVVGAGQVVIDDESGNDTIVLNRVATSAGLMLSATNDPNVIVLGTGGGGNVFIKNGLGGGAVENIQLADGTMISYSSLIENYNTQILNGDDQDGYIEGGEYTNDTIYGGKGRDLLVGGGGNDTFIFNLGDGKDVLREYPHGRVTLKFGSGVSIVQINAQNACALAKDIVLSYGDKGDSILIKDGQAGVINKIEFADGTTMSAAQIAKQFKIGNADLKTNDGPDVIHGTIDDDRIFGNGGSDILYGEGGNDYLFGEDGDNSGIGNDSLFGGNGDDTLFGEDGDDYLVGGRGNDQIGAGYGADTIAFDRGDGQDIINWDVSNWEDTLQLGAGISLQDLEFHRLAQGDLVVQIRNSDDKITLTRWYNGGSDAKLSNVRFDDGTTFQLSSLSTLPITPVLGTDGDDTMSGTQLFDDVISAGAGNDALSGQRGNDTLDGGSGNDVFDGNQGNDQLIGSAGDDTFVLSFDMGVDTVVEASGQISKILLKDNILATDLSFELRGNDLFVGLQNVAGGTGQGLVLKEYVTQSGTWTVVDGGGNQQDLNAVRANHQVSVIALQTASESDLVIHAREQFLAHLKNELYSSWKSSGADSVARDVFESGLGQDLNVSFSREINGFFTYDEQGFQSGTNGSTERIDFNVTGAPNADYFNAYRKQIAVIQHSSNLDQIERTSEWSTDIQTTTQVGIDLAAQTGEVTHNEYLAQAEDLPNPTPNARFVRREIIDDQILFRGQLTSVMEQPSSEYLTLTDASKAYFDTGTFAEKFLLTKNYADSATNIENLTAGASANDINVGGYAFIDAGAGDDVVNQQNFDERGFVDTDNPERSPELGAGQFIYGGDGNDKLWGTGGSDQLIGGQGHDFLNGGAGADTYYILPTAQGSDVIYDSGYPFSHDGWEEIYKNWFYGNEGYPNWHDLQYSGALPDLPDFPINDYEALDAIVRAGVLARDTIEFAPGIALGDLSFAWGQADVTLIDGSTTPMRSLNISWGVDQSIQVAMPSEYERPGAGIEMFKFADGATLTMAEALRHAPPMPPNEIIGSADDDYLSGSSTGDHIVGLGGSDTLYSASGNDLMEGGTGDDIYVWSPGNGQDIIAETDITVGNQDTLQLYGLLPSDITVTRDINNLHIEINGTDGADKLTLKDFFVPGGEIEQVQFDDGTVWDAATLISHIQEGSTNHAPTLSNPISGQAIAEKQFWVLAIPAETFADIDAGDQLTYQATLENGDPLPAWLTFDSATKTFSGIAGNAEVGQISLKLTATDRGGLSAATSFTLSVSNVNDAPIVTAVVANQSTLEDAAFSFVVPAGTFQDIDTGDSLALTAELADGSALPTWLNFDAITQTFSGTPGNSEVGNLSIKLSATDQSGATASTQFALSVANVNDAPVVSMTIANQATLEDAAFTYVIPANTFTDIDAGDVLSLSATLADGTALPSWLSFNAAARTLSGTPGNSQVGSLAITLTATDQAGATATTNLNVSITNVNDAPVVNVLLSDQAVVEYKAFSYVVPANTFTDIDVGDTAVINATLDDGSALPDWLTFDPDTLTFSGTPTSMDIGVTKVKVTVTDQGGLSASDVFDLTVNAAPGQKINGTAGNDVLTGLSGNDTLNGGAGADTMSGGTGNDKYVVDNIGDVIIEKLNEGTDTVQSSITYTLGANVELLQLTGTAAINGTGNELNNTLTGNSAANILNGGAGDDSLNGATGADTMLGGVGNDNYTVDNTGDIVTELANEGTDRVKSYITYTLGNNVENLTLLGTMATDGTGNALANSLTGNSAANRLAGGDGNDILNGSGGNDTLLGDAGDDTLTGGTGADTLVGGIGNDVYVVTDGQDTVTELANEGIDRVNAAISYTLGDKVENLTLTGTAENYGIGNSLDNVLTGNNAKNYLNGLAGNDTIRGNGANDILQGGMGNDTISDNGGQNVLDGGAGIDTLTGSAGNEMFIGGQGNDTITTGTGADLIVFNQGDGQDTVKASVGADNTLSLGGGIKYTDLTLSKAGSDLIVGTGTGESIKFSGWYSITANNKSVVNLQMIAEAMADFDAAGSDTLKDNQVETFNFAGIVDKFEQARGTSATFSNWAMTNALMDFHLSGSDTAALGGDLAYQHGKNGNLANVSINPAQGILGGAQFGTTAQTLQPVANLQDNSPRLG